MEVVDKSKRKRGEDSVSNIVPFQFKPPTLENVETGKKVDVEGKKEVGFAKVLSEEFSPIPYITKWDDLVNAEIFWLQHPKTKWTFNGYYRYNLDEGTGFVNDLATFEQKQALEKNNANKKLFLGGLVQFLAKYKAISLDSQPGMDGELKPVGPEFQKKLDEFIAADGKTDLWEEETEDVQKNFLKYIKKKMKENPKFQYMYGEVQHPYLDFIVPREIGLKLLKSLQNHPEFVFKAFDLKTKKAYPGKKEFIITYSIYPSEPNPISPESDETEFEAAVSEENVKGIFLQTQEKWTPEIVNYAYNETFAFWVVLLNSYSTATFFKQLLSL